MSFIEYVLVALMIAFFVIGLGCAVSWLCKRHKKATAVVPKPSATKSGDQSVTTLQKASGGSLDVKKATINDLRVDVTSTSVQRNAKPMQASGRVKVNQQEDLRDSAWGATNHVLHHTDVGSHTHGSTVGSTSWGGGGNSGYSGSCHGTSGGDSGTSGGSEGGGCSGGSSD